LPTRLSEININAEEVKALAKKHFPADIKLGGYGELTLQDILNVIELAK